MGGLSLIKTDFEQLEKRVLPRYPLCYLTFKEFQTKEKKVYEVKEISMTGMQLCLRDGDVHYKNMDVLEGCLHWIGQSLELKGEVKWVKGNRLGVAFQGGEPLQETVRSFMSPSNIAKNMKPIPFLELDYDTPNDLNLWLRGDGPSDLFLWEYKDEAISKFQLIIMNHFIEWEDGKGLTTGSVLTQRSLDMPLSEKDEVVFKVDEFQDDQKIQFAVQVISELGENKLEKESQDFIMRKLRG
jgi:hypothetical protein